MTFARSSARRCRLLDRPRPRALARRPRADARHAGRRRGAGRPSGGSAAGEPSRGLRLVADAFYRGPIARSIDAWSRPHGGLIRYVDLATHITRVEEPVAVDYRGHTVYKCGAWTQGPCLLEALQILEGFDLEGDGPQPARDAIHTDRRGDEARPWPTATPTTPTPSSPTSRSGELLDAGVCREAAGADRPGPRLARAPARRSPRGQGRCSTRPRTRPAARPARPPRSDTTTCLVADRYGNVVAATPSGWSGVVAGDTGVWLGSRLQSFNTWEGHPNVIEPGKRPRITLSPTIVLEDGRPVLAVSVAGGDNQDQMTLQLLVNQSTSASSPRRPSSPPGS